MVLCDRCGNVVDLPFRCNYCGGYFCGEHRLPEFHNCTGLYKGREAVNIGRRNSYKPTGFYQVPRRRGTGVFSFSEREIRHLALGLLIISIIPLMWFRGLVFRNASLVLGALGIFGGAFLLHELAHKFSAQRLGYWAEFRLNVLGLLITLMSFFSPLKVIAPGAVVISGLMYGDDYGKISLAGPLTNIIQALMFLVVGFFSSNQLFNVGIIVNSSLALFNLLPFSEFDGAKIFRWDKRLWVAAFAVAGLLFIYST
jgi:Zn-dependent protease